MWEKGCRCRSKWHNRPNQAATLAVISNPIYSQQPSIPAHCSCWGKGLSVHLCSLTAPVQHGYRTHARMTVKSLFTQWRNRFCQMSTAPLKVFHRGTYLVLRRLFREENDVGRKQRTATIFASMREPQPPPEPKDHHFQHNTEQKKQPGEAQLKHRVKQTTRVQPCLFRSTTRCNLLKMLRFAVALAGDPQVTSQEPHH